MSPDNNPHARVYDDLLDRNRSLIELAQSIVDDRRRQRRLSTERFARACARGLQLCERSRGLAVRLSEIRAATEDHCRRSRRTLEQTVALMARPVSTRE